MRKPLIVGNWKMNTTLADAMVLGTSVKNAILDLGIDVVLCPPFVWLYPLMEVLERGPKNLHLGAQNMWFEDKGAMTGEVSPPMIKSLAKFVILGHSERRSHIHEDNGLVNDKVMAALRHNLTPIVCVGEQKKSQINVFADLRKSLKKIPHADADKIVVAYEPVWAIGSGDPATGAYAGEMIGKIRETLAQIFSQSISERIKILYGGSVDSENVREFVFQPEIDGVLVGGASLRAKEFIKICREANR